jgi:hypothetical protein
MICPGTSPDTNCEKCLAENCCDAYTKCEDDVACTCTLQCKDLLCALGCNLNLKNLAGLVNYLAGIGLVENGNDGCLIDQCGLLCPVAGLL